MHRYFLDFLCSSFMTRIRNDITQNREMRKICVDIWFDARYGIWAKNSFELYGMIRNSYFVVKRSCMSAICTRKRKCSQKIIIRQQFRIEVALILIWLVILWLNSDKINFFVCEHVIWPPLFSFLSIYSLFLYTHTCHAQRIRNHTIPNHSMSLATHWFFHIKRWKLWIFFQF